MTEPVLSNDDLVRWAAPLGSLIETLRRRCRGTASWGPAWQSEASHDIVNAAAETRPDGLPWGLADALEVVAAAALLTYAALGSADAVRTLLASEAPSELAVEALVRAILESAAQVWWLLEPGIGGRARVARLYVLRRQSADSLQGTAAKLQVQLGSGHSASELEAQYERDLGLRPDHSHKGVWVGCEGQKRMGYTDRVAWFMGDIGHAEDKGPYAFMCGASHMEFWRLSYGYEEIKHSDGSREWMPQTPRDFLRFALSVTTDALVYPAARAFELLGRRAAFRELVGLLPKARRALAG